MSKTKEAKAIRDEAKAEQTFTEADMKQLQHDALNEINRLKMEHYEVLQENRAYQKALQVANQRLEHAYPDQDKVDNK